MALSSTDSAAPLAVWSNIEPGLGIVAGSLATLRPLTRVCLGKARNIASEAQSACRRHSRFNDKSGDNNNSDSNNNDINYTYQSKCAKASYDGRDWRNKSSNPLTALGYGNDRNVSDITATTTITTTYDRNTNRNSYKSHEVYDISEKSASSPGALSENSSSSRPDAGTTLAAQPYLYQYRQEQQQGQQHPHHEGQHQQWYHETSDDRSRRSNSGSSSTSSECTAIKDQTHTYRCDSHDNNQDESNWPFRPISATYKKSDVTFGGEEV